MWLRASAASSLPKLDHYPEVLELKRLALIARARLGGPMTVVGQLPGLSSAVVDVIASSQKRDELYRNPSLTLEGQRAARACGGVRRGAGRRCRRQLRSARGRRGAGGVEFYSVSPVS